MAVIPTKKPNFTKYSLKDLVERADPDHSKRDDPAYQFSNGAVKLSTDHTEKGFYKRS